MNWIERYIAKCESLIPTVSDEEEADLHFINLTPKYYGTNDLKLWNCHRLFFIPQGGGLTILRHLQDNPNGAASLLKFPEINQVVLVPNISGVSKIIRYLEE